MGKTKKKLDPIEKIRFDIEDLLAPENLMNSDSVKVLQDNLNKYVYGYDLLAVDGNLGKKTLKGIRQFQDDSRYWGGHSIWKLDPLKTYENYKVQEAK